MNGYNEAVALKYALAWSLMALSITFITLIIACYYLPKEEPTKLERAKALGESLD